MKRKSLIELLKYGIVGVMNTFLTLFVIYLCNSIIGLGPYISNCLGYVAGFVNSFMWNKTWVFHSQGKTSREAALFLWGFVACYCVQLCVVWLINQPPFGQQEFRILDHTLVLFGHSRHFEFVLTGYGIATLVGNVAYTLCNFLYNKLITFKAR